ncbi:hypothetical protein TWF106_008685 [Orbilia oligospora]|uniref:Uncharacterized protein n=1 Tax=Orbilia oligospora TaxID=2813651 RepID=A0A7C8UPS0_ORBOL|nr:hypothetical protein TWF106_008685 [Orbilia oligospora]
MKFFALLSLATLPLALASPVVPEALQSPAVALQHERRNCSTRRTASSNSTGPPSQKLDMTNPLYRDLIKSIKNPFVRDSIHRLVQGETVFDESISQDLHGTGNSLYFRVPELPPTMKGHSHDPDGIPLPPNTFRVSSTEELRNILGRILEYRAHSWENEENADYIRAWGDEGLYDNLGASETGAATESVKDDEKKKKEDTPQVEPKKSELPKWESKIPDMPDWKPSEKFENFKEKFNQYVKASSQLVPNRPPGVSMASVLETLEQQIRKSRESLEKKTSHQDTAKSLNIDYEARKHREDRLFRGVKKPRSMWGHREFLEHLSETRRKKTPGDFGPLSREDAKKDDSPSDSPQEPPVDSTPMTAKAPNPQPTSSVGQEDKPLEKSPTANTDDVEPATERITLMDILNGTASSSPEKAKQETEVPTTPAPLPGKHEPPEPLVNDRSSTSSTKLLSESNAGLLEAIGALSVELSRAYERILELEARSAGPPDFQRFTEYVDRALDAQYINMRDYFEKEVLSETSDISSSRWSLEKTMQKILENQEAAAAAAKSREGACIYSTESGEPGEEPKVPVTVQLDDTDKANLQGVVDAAVKIAIKEIVAGIEKYNDDNKEGLVEAIGEEIDAFRYSSGLTETIVQEILNSESMSRRLDIQCKIIVGQVLEMLGKDENGDLQRIVDAAVKGGTKDLEETVKSRLGDIQLKLFGMERLLRESRRKRKSNDQGWFW